jgi:2-iminobutanoate/2-iminopropanoate deaminase
MSLLDFNQEVCIMESISKAHSALRFNSERISMKTIIQSPNAPKPVGPYSQAVLAGDFLFCAGQIAIDPATDKVLSSADVPAQTERVMENIKAVLKSAEMDFQHVIKTTIYLTDMNDFSQVNQTYARYFPEGSPLPARSTVAVAALPKGVRVEIEVVAYRG